MGYNSGASSGNLQLIQSQTAAAAASISFTTGIGASFNDYYVIFDGVQTSSNGDTLTLVYSTNGGSSYAATNYNSVLLNANNGGTSTNNGTTFNYISTAQDVTTSLYGNLTLFSLNNGKNPYTTGFISYINSGNNIMSNSSSFSTNTTVNAIRFIYGTGNITGTIKLFGIRN